MALSPTLIGTVSLNNQSPARNEGDEDTERVAYLLYVPIAVVCAALTKIVDVVSPKHDRQRHQTWRPCDHHSKEEPLIGFHCSVPLSYSVARDGDEKAREGALLTM
jgi:hypothetical protein